MQVVAVFKALVKSNWQHTLREAAEEKKRKYKAYGSSFQPLIFSAGGFMEQTTAKQWKAFQKALGSTAAGYLEATIALSLSRTRAISAISIRPE